MMPDVTYKKLGEVAEVLNGFAFKSSEYIAEGIRVIRIANVQKGAIVDDAPAFYPRSKEQGLKRYMLREDDILMSLTGNVGRVGLLPKEMLPAALNQRVACLRIINPAISFKFLYSYLNSDFFEQQCIAASRGIAQLNMSTEWLKEQLIPIPSLDIQHSIVRELDAINAIIADKRQQLAELDNLAQAIFYNMFGDPIANDKGWEVKKMNELCYEFKYGTSSPATPNGKYKYLRMCNLTYNGYLDLTDIKMINVPDEEIEKCIVRKGDILFNRTNSIDLIGKTCMFDEDEPMVIAGYIIRVRVTDAVLPIYIARAFNIPSIKKLLRVMAKGAVNQANINAKELASISIPLPPLPLQQAFAAKIEAIEEQKSAVRASLTEFESLLAQRLEHHFA